MTEIEAEAATEAVVPESAPQEIPDPAQAIREEVQREFADRLVQAEIKLQAAQSGVEIPPGLLALIDPSKLVGEGGLPRQEALDVLLEAAEAAARPRVPQLEGAGFHSTPPWRNQPKVSLDARHR